MRTAVLLRVYQETFIEQNPLEWIILIHKQNA